MRDDNDWYRYFGDSTVYTVGRHGLAVHLPDSGKPNEADREQDAGKGKDSGRLEQDNEGDSD